jgi:HEAT repeat protein
MRLLVKIVLSVISISFLCAQQNRSETTAEQEFLSSVEDVIVSELAAAADRDTKLEALEFAQIAVREGRVSPGIRQAIVELAGEGTLSVSSSGGRIINNFPEIRMQACDLLGQIPAKESKDALVKIAFAEDEPVVAAAAIRSLGEIGFNDNNDAIDTIIWVQKKFSILKPTSSLAYAVLEAYEKFAPKVQDPLMTGQMVQSISEISTNYRYNKPVRDKALSLLKTIR